MFTYNNIMRALKAEGGPDYWYAQFVVNDANVQAIGLADRDVTVASAGDVAYPVYLNNYDDATQTAGTATHWYDLNADSNDGVGTAHGTDTDITYSGGGAVFNGVSSYIDLFGLNQVGHNHISVVVNIANYKLSGYGEIVQAEYTTTIGTGQPTFGIYMGGGNIRIQRRTNTGVSSGITYPVSMLPDIILIDAVRNGDNTKLYINGAIVADETSLNLVTVGDAPYKSTIGYRWANSGSTIQGFFNGVIYDLKLHSSALTPAQIKANAISIGLYGEQLATQDNFKVWHDKIAGDIYSKLTRYNYDDASQTAGTATHWYELNTDSNDSVGTAHGTNTDITYSNGGAVFNGTTSKIALPSSVYAAQWRTLEVVFDLNDALNSILFNIRNAASVTLFDIRIFDNGDISYRVFTDALYTASAATKIVANKKYYAVLTYNSTTGEILGYLDGELVAQATTAVAGNHGTGTAAAIGYFINYNDAFVNGTIYDLKLHSTTLTPAQIKANALAIGLYDGPIETEYTGITADLKPASYDPADTTLDTTSTIATNPDANDWQPYGA